jgi:hypothetical protein
LFLGWALALLVGLGSAAAEPAQPALSNFAPDDTLLYLEAPD